MSRYPGFRVRFRGFDRAEVMAAMAKLRSENDEAWRDLDRMGAEIDRLQTSMAEQVDNERHMQRVLIVAAKVADEIRQRAEEESARILRDAHERGEAIVGELRDQARGIETQIEALLARRRDVESSIEALVKTLSAELELARQHQREDSVDPPLTGAATGLVRFG